MRCKVSDERSMEMRSPRIATGMGMGGGSSLGAGPQQERRRVGEGVRGCEAGHEA